MVTTLQYMFQRRRKVDDVQRRVLLELEQSIRGTSLVLNLRNTALEKDIHRP